MPRVDFYILSEHNIPPRFVCNLTSKARSEGQGVHIQARDKEQAQQLDDSLWTFRDISFLPHVLADDPEAGQYAVTIGWPGMPPRQTDVLIDLCHTEPQDCQGYTRVLELVSAETEHKQRARELYRQYKEQDCELHTHNL
ncbi:MAG: DNA polymerase III subunit chi [Gammaproteobacteria bacterium]